MGGTCVRRRQGEHRGHTLEDPVLSVGTTILWDEIGKEAVLGRGYNLLTKQTRVVKLRRPNLGTNRGAWNTGGIIPFGRKDFPTKRQYKKS